MYDSSCGILAGWHMHFIGLANNPCFDLCDASSPSSMITKQDRLGRPSQIWIRESCWWFVLTSEHFTHGGEAFLQSKQGLSIVCISIVNQQNLWTLVHQTCVQEEGVGNTVQELQRNFNRPNDNHVSRDSTESEDRSVQMRNNFKIFCSVDLHWIRRQFTVSPILRFLLKNIYI